MICANKECLNGKEFTPKTHNQKYCCDECCRVATNKKIMDKYYEKKSIRSGAKRECVQCKARLSRYNQSNICSRCEKNSAVKNKSTILRMLNDIS